MGFGGKGTYWLDEAPQGPPMLTWKRGRRHKSSLGERLESTAQFVERARKLVERADAAILKAQAERARLCEEFRRRLELLQAAAAKNTNSTTERSVDGRDRWIEIFTRSRAPKKRRAGGEGPEYEAERNSKTDPMEHPSDAATKAEQSLWNAAKTTGAATAVDSGHVNQVAELSTSKLLWKLANAKRIKPL